MLFHDRAPAAERADRHAAADHLAERRQVGRDAVEPLRAARMHAKAGHHLVEDQHGAVAIAQRAQPLEESGACGSTRFMLPATGSTMMPAIASRSASNAACDRGRDRCNGSTIVSPAIAGGTPADDGWPNVSAPEPALTSRLSPWP